jgi:hypothetical protein
MNPNNKYLCTTLISGLLTSLFAANALAASSKSGGTGVSVNDNPKVCKGFGPQAPRDIDSLVGTNKRMYTQSADSSQMNLCNIHFHAQAEHKAKDFSIVVKTNDDFGGYQCNMSSSLTAAEKKPYKNNACKDVAPGDTIEMHWVFSSCAVKPGETLGACLSEETCSTPQLRVETQVFTVVNDRSALNFNDFTYDGDVVDGYHQAKAIPQGTGKPVEYLGSTTGPEYNDQCSSIQASWSVRPHCAKVDIASLSKWCESNVFNENYAHGIRELVTNPKLLSEM